MKQQFKYVLHLLFLVLLFSPCLVQAQSQTMEDVVYLKNGGIIRGTIIEQIPNKTLKIEIVGRNVFVFQFEEIEKIVKAPVENATIEKQKTSTEEYDRGKFTFIVESNLAFMLKPNSETSGLKSGSGASIGLGLVFAANLHPKVSLGLGGGVDLLGGSMFIPLFLDFRYYFTTKPVTPYFSFSGGWAIGESYKIEGPSSNYNIEVRSDGGVYANPNFGVRWNVARKAALNFGLGARLQINSVKIKTGYYSERYQDLLPLINLKVGAIF